MGKSKKKRQQDFQKVKLKVGRKLKKGDNVTNASFKTRTVQVTQQLKTGHVTEPSTRRKQNIGELLSHCRHYNTTVRHEAVTGLRELVISFPETVDQNLAAILEKSSELFIDKDASVRQGVIRLLKAYLPRVTEKQMSPFFPLLCAHLCCAMTHIYDQIQVDSLSVLDILLERFPRLMVSKSNLVLTNFIDQISRQQSQGQDIGSRSLTVNPNSKISSLKWRTSVLNRLEKFVSAILECQKEKLRPDLVASDEHDIDTKWSTDRAASVVLYPSSWKHSWEIPGLDLGSSGVGSGLEDQVPEKLQGFVATLFPLLLECWVESVPSKQGSGGAGNLLHTDTVGIVGSILTVTQLLIECGQLCRNESQECGFEEKYIKDFQHHFLANFPFSLHDVPALKDKADKTEQISAEDINLTICDIMTQLLANQQDPIIPEWLPGLISYLKDFLTGKYTSKMQGQNSKVIVKSLNRLMTLNLKETVLQDLLSIALRRYKRAHCLSTEKMVYLRFFSQICVSNLMECSVSDEIRTGFLSSLPELFTLVAKGNQDTGTLILRTMKRAASQRCAGVLDLIGKQCHTWFEDDKGQFLHVDTRLQREMVSLLYFLPNIDSKLYETLVILTRQLDIQDSELDYMLQVLQERYMAFSEDQAQTVLYIGFLGSLIVGCLGRENFRTSIYVSYKSLGGQYIDDISGSVEMWNRHVFIVQKVCMLISLFSNQEQVKQVMESFVSRFCQKQLISKEMAYGSLRFAAFVSTSTGTVTGIRDLAFSIIHYQALKDNNNIPPELLELAVDVVGNSPEALLELFNRMLQQNPDIVMLRICLIFLDDKRKHYLRDNTRCLTAVRDIIKHHRENMSLDSEGIVQDPALLKLVTELEYHLELL